MLPRGLHGLKVLTVLLSVACWQSVALPHGSAPTSMSGAEECFRQIDLSISLHGCQSQW